MASVGYGIARDMVTAHYCPQYFLPPHHPIIFETQVPFLLALIWGVLATFWMGAIFGTLVATCAVVGRYPLLPFPRLKKALVRGLAVILVLAVLALVAVHFIGGYAMSRHPDVPDLDRRLAAAAVAHGLSYTATAILGIGLCIWSVVVRYKLSRSNESSPIQESD